MKYIFFIFLITLLTFPALIYTFDLFCGYPGFVSFRLFLKITVVLRVLVENVAFPGPRPR